MPEFVAVESSNVRAIGFDQHSQTLFVQFIGRKGSADSIYKYIAVPPALYERFLNAPSKGVFFSSEIKGKFAHERAQ
jgi:hypothetical protein